MEKEVVPEAVGLVGRCDEAKVFWSKRSEWRHLREKGLGGLKGRDFGEKEWFANSLGEDEDKEDKDDNIDG